MKKTFMTMFLLTVCSVGLAVAQAPDQPQRDQQQTSPSSSSMGKNMTVTGCLQPGTEPNSFVLFNATPSDMSQRSYQDDRSNPQTQARGDYPDRRSADDQTQSQDESQMDNSPSEMAKTETSYMLVPDGRVDLKNYVGKRVEVTGKISETSSRTNQSSRATTPSGQSSSIHSSTEMTGQPQFRVSSIRQISQSCQ